MQQKEWDLLADNSTRTENEDITVVRKNTINDAELIHVSELGLCFSRSLNAF